MRYADNHCTYTETFEGDNHLYVYKGKCIVTGKTITVKVPAPALYAYRQGAYIQNALSMLSADEREFLMSGIGSDGWDEIFKEEEAVPNQP